MAPATLLFPLILAMVPLPSRHVDASSIDQAYVGFIFACNPSVAPDTDTAVLREAFRTPPRSGNKAPFSTWVLFQLVAQFQSKQIRTWGDLALRLGVEPPDQAKGESPQKIQQYAVRLKVKLFSRIVRT